MRLLIIEDDAKVRRALVQGLEREGYQVVAARTGEEGFFLLCTEEFDLVVLDLMLPGRDGMQVLRAARAKGMDVPILVLTARDAIEDRVEGLDAGADDYLVKPFAFAELAARIRALLRRGRTDQVLKLKVADLELDLVTRRAVRGSRVLNLTQREFEILEFLMRNAGRIVSRGMIARNVWNEPDRSAPLDNVIDVHISHLRRKVDGFSEKKLIHTIRGVGFMLSEDAP